MTEALKEKSIILSAEAATLAQAFIIPLEHATPVPIDVEMQDAYVEIKDEEPSALPLATKTHHIDLTTEEEAIGKEVSGLQAPNLPPKPPVDTYELTRKRKPDSEQHLLTPTGKRQLPPSVFIPKDQIKGIMRKAVQSPLRMTSQALPPIQMGLAIKGASRNFAPENMVVNAAPITRKGVEASIINQALDATHPMAPPTLEVAQHLHTLNPTILNVSPAEESAREQDGERHLDRMEREIINMILNNRFTRQQEMKQKSSIKSQANAAFAKALEEEKQTKNWDKLQNASIDILNDTTKLLMNLESQKVHDATYTALINVYRNASTPTIPTQYKDLIHGLD